MYCRETQVGTRIIALGTDVHTFKWLFVFKLYLHRPTNTVRQQLKYNHIFFIIIVVVAVVIVILYVTI